MNLAAVSKAYRERNLVIAALTVAFRLSSWIGRHDPSDPSDAAAKDPEAYRSFMTVVFIKLPTGQVSWSIHDDDRHLFEHLPSNLGAWDGHTTEQKNARLEEWIRR